MGIEKPYVVERGLLPGPPGRPEPLDVEARVAELVRPSADAVVVAGHALPVPFRVSGETAARELRALIVQRLRERRPHADEHTWAAFRDAADAAARDAKAADDALRHSLILAIDGL